MIVTMRAGREMAAVLCCGLALAGACYDVAPAASPCDAGVGDAIGVIADYIAQCTDASAKTVCVVYEADGGASGQCVASPQACTGGSKVVAFECAPGCPVNTECCLVASYTPGCPGVVDFFDAASSAGTVCGAIGSCTGPMDHLLCTETADCRQTLGDGAACVAVTLSTLPEAGTLGICVGP